jgi:predicted flap endonuclease-1-like 5' DNA nuclease
MEIITPRRSLSGIAIIFIGILFAPLFSFGATTVIPRLETCSLFATQYTSYGSQGFEVEKLQMFLNAYEGSDLPITGYFGPLTKGAVQAFQSKYGIAATGNQYIETSNMINALYCRPALNEVTQFVSLVPVSESIPATTQTTGTVVSNNTSNTSISVTTAPAQSPSVTVSPTTAAATPNSQGTSPINSDAYNQTMADTFNWLTLHNLIPWLMLLAALLLAFLAWRTYRSAINDEVPIEQRMLAAPSNAPMIVSPIKNASPMVITRAPTNAPIATSVRSSDDLIKIDGIGPAANKILREAGITSYAQLAAMSVDDIHAIFQKAWPHFNEPTITTWAEQAALARDGKWNEFAKLSRDLHKGVRG